MIKNVVIEQNGGEYYGDCTIQGDKITNVVKFDSKVVEITMEDGSVIYLEFDEHISLDNTL